MAKMYHDPNGEFLFMLMFLILGILAVLSILIDFKHFFK